MAGSAGVEQDPEFLKDQREEMKYGKWVTRLRKRELEPLT
jgi:hypothetical protein